LKYRALYVEPRCQFERPVVPEEERVPDELDDVHIYKDKNGVYLNRTLDFGTLEMGERRVLEVSTNHLFRFNFDVWQFFRALRWLERRRKKKT